MGCQVVACSGKHMVEVCGSSRQSLASHVLSSSGGSSEDISVETV